MKKFAILILLVLGLAGCKHEYWTITESPESEPIPAADQPAPQPDKPPEVKQPEPEPEPEPKPQPAKEVIFVLGIDGMD